MGRATSRSGSTPDHAPPGLAHAAGRLAEEIAGHPAASSFVRGATMGALVGAAIAGALLVGRRRGTPRVPDSRAATRPSRRA